MHPNGNWNCRRVSWRVGHFAWNSKYTYFFLSPFHISHWIAMDRVCVKWYVNDEYSFIHPLNHLSFAFIIVNPIYLCLLHYSCIKYVIQTVSYSLSIYFNMHAHFLFCNFLVIYRLQVHEMCVRCDDNDNSSNNNNAQRFTSKFCCDAIQNTIFIFNFPFYFVPLFCRHTFHSNIKNRWNRAATITIIITAVVTTQNIAIANSNDLHQMRKLFEDAEIKLDVIKFHRNVDSIFMCYRVNVGFVRMWSICSLLPHWARLQ